MGLADRHYMRDPYHAPHITTKLIIVLIAAFVVQCLLIFYGNIDVAGPGSRGITGLDLGLTLEGISHGKIWQLITFQFLHTVPWPWHVLFNCIGLYFFGRPVEQMFGAKKFILLYLLAGIMGGILQVLTTLVLPHHYDFPVVGASAGICGIIAIFCAIHPMQELTTWIYFFPVTIRAKYFLMGLAGFSLFGTLIPFDNIANAAHLGGILFGLGYVRWGTVWEGFFRWKPFSSGQKQRREPGKTAAKGKYRNRPYVDNPTETPEEDFISREVDPILDKISKHGIQSLTERERGVLEAARWRSSGAKRKS